MRAGAKASKNEALLVLSAIMATVRAAKGALSRVKLRPVDNDIAAILRRMQPRWQ